MKSNELQVPLVGASTSELAKISFPRTDYPGSIVIPKDILNEGSVGISLDPQGNIILARHSLPASAEVKPVEDESGFLVWAKDTVVDNTAALIFSAVVAYLAARVAALNTPRQRLIDQIAIENIEFRHNGRAHSKPVLNFRQFQSDDIAEILDPAAVELFKSAIKEARRDSLSFIMFPNGKKTDDNAHHLIALPMTRWIEGQIGAQEVNDRAAKDRMREGITHTSSRAMTRYLCFFTCDKLASIEQPRVVLVQQEDIINVLTDLNNWWKSTELESAVDEADNQLRLSRVVEFAVSLAHRHPLALQNMFPDQKDKVNQALENAKKLEKLLIVPPEESVKFIDTLLRAQVDGRSIFDVDYAKLPPSYKMSDREWLEVLEDWYFKNDPSELKGIFEAEQKLRSLDKMPDSSIANGTPLWAVISEKPQEGE